MAAAESNEAILRAIGRIIARTCPQGVGFALFVAGDVGGYLSNATRGDMATTVSEWLARVHELGTAPVTRSSINRGNTPGDLAAQHELERQCALVGQGIEQAWTLGTGREPLFMFFLFDFGGPGGRLAWRGHGQPAEIVQMIRAWLFQVDPSTGGQGS